MKHRWATVAMGGVLVILGSCTAEPTPEEEAEGGSAGSLARGGSGSAKGGTGGSGAVHAGGAGSPAQGGTGGHVPLSRDDCKQYESVEQCEQAGCFPASGTIYRPKADQAGGTGGMENAGGHACDVVEDDAFVTCLETGEGGAVAVWRCEEDCARCVEGGWQVPESERFTRADCDWHCN